MSSYYGIDFFSSNKMVKNKNKENNTKTEKPKLSLMSGIALLVGSIIGSGIFISPRGVLLGTGKF